MCVVPLIVVVARNVVALLRGIIEVVHRLYDVDIIDMSLAAVNSVLVIIKSGQYSITVRGRKQA